MSTILGRAARLAARGVERSLYDRERRIDFFVAGVQKGGTTALHGFLNRHSKIQMSRKKEPHIFDAEDADWRAPNYFDLHEEFDWRRTDVLRGEATPIYLFWPDALTRIAEYRPDSKLIVGLRHPTFRAYSQWRMERARGDEDLPFEDAISDRGRARIGGMGQRGRRLFTYVERGFYGDQLEAALTRFPREAVHVYRTDRLWLNPAETLSGIERFLGLESELAAAAPVCEYVAPVTPAAPRAAMEAAGLTPDVRARLDALYADDLAKASRLTGLDLSDWLDPAYAEPMKA